LKQKDYTYFSAILLLSMSALKC